MHVLLKTKALFAFWSFCSVLSIFLISFFVAVGNSKINSPRFIGHVSFRSMFIKLVFKATLVWHISVLYFDVSNYA